MQKNVKKEKINLLKVYDFTAKEMIVPQTTDTHEFFKLQEKQRR